MVLFAAQRRRRAKSFMRRGPRFFGRAGRQRQPSAPLPESRRRAKKRYKYRASCSREAPARRRAGRTRQAMPSQEADTAIAQSLFLFVSLAWRFCWEDAERTLGNSRRNAGGEDLKKPQKRRPGADPVPPPARHMLRLTEGGRSFFHDRRRLFAGNRAAEASPTWVDLGQWRNIVIYRGVFLCLYSRPGFFSRASGFGGRMPLHFSVGGRLFFRILSFRRARLIARPLFSTR